MLKNNEGYFDPQEVATALITWSEFYHAVAKGNFSRKTIEHALLNTQYGDFLQKYKKQYKKETRITLYLRPNSEDIVKMVDILYEHYREERELNFKKEV